MASNFSAVNPKPIATAADGSFNELINLEAADGVTWKAGEFGYLSSGKVTPVSGATGGTAVYCIFAENQDTATSSSTVPVRVVQDGALFEIYVTNNGTDAAIATANIGTKYGIYTGSNISYLDVNVTSGADFEVVKLAAVYEPEENLAADTPGKCIVKFVKA